MKIQVLAVLASSVFGLSCIPETFQAGMSPYDKVVSSKFSVVFRGNNVPSVPGIDTLDKALSSFVEKCDESFGVGKCLSAVSGVTVVWWDKIAPRASTGELGTTVVYNGVAYSGLTTRDGTCRVAWRGKLFRSAFSHELMHVVSGRILGDWDEEHKIEKVWLVDREVSNKLKELDI